MAPSYNSPLRRAEEAKIIKYAEKINNLNSNSYTPYLLCSFAFSLFGTLGKTALSLVEDFSSIVTNRIGFNCSNSPQLTLRHALNCSKLITCRFSFHDAIRDTVFKMVRTARMSCIKEPLLREKLSLNNFGSNDRDDE
ncbi:hypothetical protein P9112_009528 [Eukaryota sp. TZLM1-RC]